MIGKFMRMIADRIGIPVEWLILRAAAVIVAFLLLCAVGCFCYFLVSAGAREYQAAEYQKMIAKKYIVWIGESRDNTWITTDDYSVYLRETFEVSANERGAARWRLYVRPHVIIKENTAKW